jgi:methionyl-tRNA formyltransferase
VARLRVGFAGTPPFAAQALDAIAEQGFVVPLVLTQPDRPSGRGMNVQPSAVKLAAVRHGFAVAQPPSLKGEAARASLVATELDVLVVAAYGLILPPTVLAWPRHGGLNIHASLLPRWRGAAPIQHALLAGDSETGITIMQMDAGLDTGAIVEASVVPIAARETAGTLTAKLASEGARAIVHTLLALERDGRLASRPQPAVGVTYAGKVERAHAAIDWREPATALDRRIRAFDPAPGAFFLLDGAPVKIWEAAPARGAGAAPGAIAALDAEAMVVACGEGALRVRTVQPAGGKRMSAAAFAAGRRLQVGARFA